jgi:signal-induced proliferation-associated 1 like protein 1
VQHDGLITEVENFGYAWQTGLRQGSRLVEICRHPVTTLTHQQMVDLLKTSRTVAVTVIPPHPDGSPRQGCHLAPGCSYAFGGFEGDYENVNGEGEKAVGVGAGTVQAPSNGKMRYERSLSPPRSVQIFFMSIFTGTGMPFFQIRYRY